MFGAAERANAAFAAAVHQKTGMVAQGDRFVGVVQGLSVWSKTEMIGNTMASLRGGGGLLGGLAGLMGGTGGMVHAMTGGAFFMKHEYVVELPNQNLPGGSIRESTTFANDRSWQQRPAIGPRVSSGVQWIDARYEVCSPHPSFMAYVCAFQPLQQHLASWMVTNLSWEPRRVHLELIDSPQRITSHFGTDAQQDGSMIQRGIGLVTSAAYATFAR